MGVTVRSTLIRNDPVDPLPESEPERREKGTEWRRWETDLHMDHTSVIWLTNRRGEGGGRSDKGQGFGCDKERPSVLPWLLTLSPSVHL